MNKKVFTMILVVLLAMTFVFASRGETKVSLNLGVGSDNVAYDSDKPNEKLNGIVIGGNATVAVQYGLSSDDYLKAEIGFNTYSDGAIYLNGEVYQNYVITDRNPNCVFYFGYVYNMALGNSGLFEWETSVGLQGAAGSCFKGNDFNLSLGLGFEETFLFNITKSLSVNLTTRAGIQFINTNSEFAKWLSDCNSLSIPVFMTAGVTYSL